jgi:hypothetical protein
MRKLHIIRIILKPVLLSLIISSYLADIRVTSLSEERSSVAFSAAALLICSLLLAGIKAINSQPTNKVKEMISD